MATVSRAGVLCKLRSCCSLIHRHGQAAFGLSLSDSTSDSVSTPHTFHSHSLTTSSGEKGESWEVASLGLKEEDVQAKSKREENEKVSTSGASSSSSSSSGSTQFVDRIHVSSWKEVLRSQGEVLEAVDKKLRWNLHKRAFYSEDELKTLASHLAKLLIRQAYVNQPSQGDAHRPTTLLFSAFLEVLHQRFTMDEKRLLSSVLHRLGMLPSQTVEQEVVDKALKFFVRKRDQGRDLGLLDRDSLSKSIQLLSKIKTSNKDNLKRGLRRNRRGTIESKGKSNESGADKVMGDVVTTKDGVVTTKSLVWDVARVFRELPYTSAENIATFLRGAQELGFEPRNKGQKRFVSESMKEVVLGEDCTCTDLARSLRALLYWSNWGILHRSLVETVLAKFYDILSSQNGKAGEFSSMKPTYAAFMFGFISYKEENFSSDQLDTLVQYVVNRSSLGDIIEASERINRPIRYTFLQEFCNSYMSVVMADPERYHDRIPDLLYGAAKKGLIVEAFKVHQLIEKFLEKSAGGAARARARTRQIARMIYAIERMDVSEEFSVDDLIKDFYQSLQDNKATANELVIVLAAIASNKQSKCHDPQELILRFLDQVSECSRTELLPALQVIIYLLISKSEAGAEAGAEAEAEENNQEELIAEWGQSKLKVKGKGKEDHSQHSHSHPSLAYRVAKAVFERFSQYKAGLFSPKEITEMLSTVAEVGYTPSMANIRRCLQSIAKEGKAGTSLDLVNAMTALGRMEIKFDERTKIVDAIIYSFGDNLEAAASEDLANFLHSLAQLNFSPEASTLELLDKIDKLLIFRSKDES